MNIREHPSYTHDGYDILADRGYTDAQIADHWNAVRAAPVIVTDPTKLVPGTWYAIGMENGAGEIEYGQILLFEDGVWTDANGDLVYSLWDSFLRMPVAMNAADAYAAQGRAS